MVRIMALTPRVPGIAGRNQIGFFHPLFYFCAAHRQRTDSPRPVPQLWPGMLIGSYSYCVLFPVPHTTCHHLVPSLPVPGFFPGGPSEEPQHLGARVQLVQTALAGPQHRRHPVRGAGRELDGPPQPCSGREALWVNAPAGWVGLGGAQTHAGDDSGWWVVEKRMSDNSGVVGHKGGLCF